MRLDQEAARIDIRPDPRQRQLGKASRDDLGHQVVHLIGRPGDVLELQGLVRVERRDRQPKGSALPGPPPMADSFGTRYHRTLGRST
jgi:hypothetical protein